MRLQLSVLSLDTENTQDLEKVTKVWEWFSSGKILENTINFGSHCKTY